MNLNGRGQGDPQEAALKIPKMGSCSQSLYSPGQRDLCQAKLGIGTKGSICCLWLVAAADQSRHLDRENCDIQEASVIPKQRK